MKDAILCDHIQSTNTTFKSGTNNRDPRAKNPFLNVPFSTKITSISFMHETLREPFSFQKSKKNLYLPMIIASISKKTKTREL